MRNRDRNKERGCSRNYRKVTTNKNHQIREIATILFALIPKSRMVNEVIKPLSSWLMFLFFLGKDFSTQKHKSNQSQPEKQNNMRIKNNKGNTFSRTKTSKKVKIVYFAFWCFFYAQNLFLKK